MEGQPGLDEKLRRLGDDVASRTSAVLGALDAFREFWVRDVAPLDATIRDLQQDIRHEASPPEEYLRSLAGQLQPLHESLERLERALDALLGQLAEYRRWLDRVQRRDRDPPTADPVSAERLVRAGDLSAPPRDFPASAPEGHPDRR